MMDFGEPPEPAERPDTDDYDLLTFGEVAARLTERLAEETDALQRASNESPPDAVLVRSIEARIALLRDSEDRYRQLKQNNEFFSRRFGSVSGATADQGPQWR